MPELRNPVNPTGRHVGREPGVRLPTEWKPYTYRGADQPEAPKPARQKKPKKQRALKPHGSIAAIRRHEKAKEPYCGPCATKAKEFYAEQYRLKKERQATS